jgi:hypothetical protein
MEDTHTPPFNLERFGIGTHAYWSLNPTGKLLVLVHGFKGAAGTTWLGLLQNLILQPQAAGCDIISFGYDSVRQTGGESAMELQIFLDKLFVKTSQVINQSFDDYGSKMRRPENWKYSQIVIAAHSLGACVSRRALLNQIQSGRNKWEVEIRLAWFAPAHRGAKIGALLCAVTNLIPSGLGKFIDVGAKYFSPALKDLEPGSEFLTELLDDTKKLCDEHLSLNAPITFWVLRDKVVTNGTFAKDVVPFEFVDGSDHVSICKLDDYDEQRIGGLLKIMSFT